MASYRKVTKLHETAIKPSEKRQSNFNINLVEKRNETNQQTPKNWRKHTRRHLLERSITLKHYPLIEKIRQFTQNLATKVQIT